MPVHKRLLPVLGKNQDEVPKLTIMDLIQNSWRSSIRNLRNQGVYGVINVLGLAIGISCCLGILAFIHSELAVNDLFSKVDRIHRIDSDWHEQSKGLPITTLAPVGPILKEAYPEIVDQSRLYLTTVNMRIEARGFRREAIVADPALFQMFDLPFIAGDPATSLNSPRSAVISEDLARTLYGTANAVGYTMQLVTPNNGEQPYRVSGVWQTVPYNSLTNFDGDRYDLVLPAPPVNPDFLEEEMWSSWNNRYLAVFVELDESASEAAFQAKLDDFIATHAPTYLHGELDLVLNPLRTLHLRENSGVVWRRIVISSSVALLLLTIACFNFVNLATTVSLNRLKEIGVRKVLGAKQHQLALQFLFESVVVSTTATLVGALLVGVVIGSFGQIIGWEDGFWHVLDFRMAAALPVFAVLVGLLAGAYPALYLSGLGIKRALEDAVRSGPRGQLLRQTLVGGQFMAAFLLLVGVYTVSDQLSHIASHDLGYVHENILVIDSVPRDWSAEGVLGLKSFRDQLSQLHGVEAASLSYQAIVGNVSNTGNTVEARRPGTVSEQSVYATQFIVDDAFDTVYGLDLKSGRFFSEARLADETGVILNEAAVRGLGLEQGVGEDVIIFDSTRVPVVGIVADFHYKSLHEPVGPLLMLSVGGYPFYRMLSVRFSGKRTQETIAAIRTEWQERFPGSPFEYFLVDQEVDHLYRPEQQIHQVLGAGAVLALLVAGLGMIGLASQHVRIRTKEIAVRKVLGSTTWSLVFLLVKDFLKPIGAAILLAIPISIVLLTDWLERFAYRTDLSVVPFFSACAATIVVGLLAVSLDVIRAAWTDPARVLKHE